jgi:CPA1 family monovalent cation:H+ antiporter
MALLEIILMLAGSVIIAHILSHYMPDIPVSLFQIGVGLVLTLVFGEHITIQTEWFLLLFVAPLLFNDAWRFPKRELWNLRGPILANAIVLVLLTTLVGGFLIHLLMPQLPTTVALALAAVISPTDPVAVQAIARRVQLPPSILHVVAGESLINDASGLVAFNTAIKATLAGTFVLSTAFENFLWLAFGGAFVGVVAAIILDVVRDRLTRGGMTDAVFHTVLTLLSPFLFYLLAEEIFHVSGVIAVVAGAIIAKFNDDRSDTPELNVISIATWDVFAYLLNGTLFVLLGIILPDAINEAIQDPTINTWMALRDGLLVWMIVFMARVIWAYLTQVTYHLRHKAHERPSFKYALISGLTGVRGAVTMAAVLSVPMVLENGEPFPQRALIIFIAAIVVVTSLLVATIMLPLVTHERTKTDFTQPEAVTEDVHDVGDLTETQAKILSLQYGVQVLREQQREGNRTLIDELIWRYQVQIRQMQREVRDNIGGEPFSAIEITLRQIALNAQRRVLETLWVNEQISNLVYQAHLRRLDQLSALFSGRKPLNLSVHLLLKLGQKGWRALRLWFADESSDVFKRQYNEAKRQMSKAAIKALSTHVHDLPEQADSSQAHEVAYHLVLSYRHQLEQAKKALNPDRKYGTLDHKKQMELEIIVLNAQREAAQQLYDSQRISRSTHLSLRQYLNYRETAVLNGDVEEGAHA